MRKFLSSIFTFALTLGVGLDVSNAQVPSVANVGLTPLAPQMIVILDSSGQWVPIASINNHLLNGNNVLIPALCDGVDDDTAIINSTLASMTRGKAILPGRTCVISSTIIIPSNVYVEGQGAGLAGTSFGIPVSGDFYGTRLLWKGASTGTLVQFASAVENGGLSNITIDGGVTSGYYTSGLTGLQMFGCINEILSNINIQYVGTGWNIAPNGPNSQYDCAWNAFHDVKILHTGIGLALVGTGSTFATDNIFYNVWVYDFSIYGIVFPEWDDSNSFFGGYIASSVNGAIGIQLNNQAGGVTDVGVFGENFYGMTIDMTGDATSHAVLVNKTTTGRANIFAGEIGLGGAGDNILVQNSGVMVFDLTLGPISGGAGFISQTCPTASPTSSWSAIVGRTVHC